MLMDLWLSAEGISFRLVHDAMQLFFYFLFFYFFYFISKKKERLI